MDFLTNWHLLALVGLCLLFVVGVAAFLVFVARTHRRMLGDLSEVHTTPETVALDPARHQTVVETAPPWVWVIDKQAKQAGQTREKD